MLCQPRKEPKRCGWAAGPCLSRDTKLAWQNCSQAFLERSSQSRPLKDGTVRTA